MSQIVSIQQIASRWVFAICFCFAIVAVSSIVAQEPPPAADQPPPLVERPYEEIREINGEPLTGLAAAERGIVGRLVREGVLAPADQPMLDKAMNNWVAELTWESNRTVLSSKRDALKKQQLRPSGTAPDLAVHNYLNSGLLARLSVLAKQDKYHPAARHAATLLLGQLDATEPDVRGLGARPLPDALPVLSELFLDGNQLEAVRIPALIGIQRHAESKATLNQEVAKALVRIVGESQAPAGMSKDGHIWMRRRAAQVIGDMGARGAPELQQPEAVKSLTALAGDSSASVLTRIDALLALSHFPKNQFSAVSGKDVAINAGSVLQAAAATADSPEMKPDWLTFFFVNMTQALRGSGSVPGLMKCTDDAEAKQWLSELSAKTDDLLNAVTARNADPVRVRQQVSAKAKELESWVASKRGGASVAEARPATGPGGQ